MEPLINFRLLASQLDPNEFNYFIQKSIQAIGQEIMLSFIFNHFLMKYNQNQEHDDNLAIIRSLMTNIIQSRKDKKSKKKKIDDNENESENKQIFTLSTIPSDLIGECASHLQTIDYLNFSQCSRKLYVSCNAPSKLHALCTNSPHYSLNKSNLNQFLHLKHLTLNPQQFNAYIASHLTQKPFSHLNTLHIDNQFVPTHQSMETLLDTKCINFGNISHLNIVCFGRSQQKYNFSSFCDSLMRFSNVINLRLCDIFLTDFDDKNEEMNEQISKLFPRLSMLSFGSGNTSLFSLRNKLLNMHSHNMVSLNIAIGEADPIQTTSFPKLKELRFTNPRKPSALLNIIKSAHDLERLIIDFDYSRNISEDNKSKESLLFCFQNCDKLENVHLTGCYLHMQILMKWTEFALLKTKHMSRQSLTLVFSCSADMGAKIEMEELNLNISRMINALVTSHIKDFMIGIHIPQSTEDNATFKQTADIFKDEHLVDFIGHTCSIVISNKDCRINGYSRRWLNERSH